MAAISKIISIDELSQKLKAFKNTSKKQLAKGLKAGGLFLQRKSQDECPVRFGFLRASAFTRSNDDVDKPEVYVGYTAAYAPFVHENVEMKWRGLPRDKPQGTVYWGPQPQAGAKFLERPAREHAEDIIAIVASYLEEGGKHGA